MSARRYLAAADLAGLVADLAASGISVFAPVLDATRQPAGGRRAPEFRRVSSLEGVVLDGAQLPGVPLKALFLPPTEALFSWKQRRNDVDILPVPPEVPPAVVLGARPCDAAAIDAVDKVMDWDYRDELWFGRRAATTVVGMACGAPGAECFCHRLGLAPDSDRGSDLLLRTMAEGYDVQVVTAKGAQLVDRFAARFGPAAGGAPGPASASAGPDTLAPDDVPFDLPAIRAWLDAHFDADLWQAIGLRCHGCGACASVCPTCHCFDIVDEPEGVAAGTRRRNWDTCQSGRFTVHASGHNPRGDQGARFRQRVVHKFAIYPERFDTLLCTGCGRCARACPAGQHLPEILETIGRAAAAASTKTTS